MSKLVLVILVLASIAILAMPVSAQTWDLASSWSNTSNLSNNWVVGSISWPDYLFNPYTVLSTASSGGCSEERWANTDGNGAQWVKGYAIYGTGPYATVDWSRRTEVGYVNSIVPWDGGNQFVAKWTAPEAGEYDVNALFTAQKNAVFFARAETRARVNVIKVSTDGTIFTYLNPTSAGPYPGETLKGFYGSLPGRADGFGTNPSYNYTGTVNLLTGESIYLATAQALTGGLYDWDWDAVGISAFITKVDQPLVPEPGSLLALGTGLFGLVGFAGRRKK